MAPSKKKKKEKLYPHLVQTSTPAPKPQLTPEEIKAAEDEAWLRSPERTAQINYYEKWIAIIAVVSSCAAMALFTWTKWEVEAKLQKLPDDDRQKWYDGTYKQAGLDKAGVQEKS